MCHKELDCGYQSWDIEWEGIPITVRYHDDWVKCVDADIVHVEIKSEDRQALPMTDTGYRSCFTDRSHVAASAMLRDLE